MPSLSRILTLMLAALGALGVLEAAAEPALPIHNPTGGWVHSGLIEGQAPVQYAYPNNLIDRGGQRGRTLIEGWLRQQQAAGARGAAPRLVVNGNAMPLYTDAQGRFARPYAFGPGSNGIEVRGSDGQVLQRVQFYEANPLKTRAKVRIILAWDDPQAELDLHVLTPNGEHAFFAAPVLAQGGGGMDVDSVDGAGPEMFSMAAPLPGVYHVYVNYWGNFGPSGYHFDESTREQPVITARITLVFDENTGAEKRETFTVPMRKIGDLQIVRSFVRG
jgi:uncharacterized protein YfaP (DUF2135 family)